MLLKNKCNLTYCSNIFKEKTWQKLFYKIKSYVTDLKHVFKKINIGLSLCLSNSLINEIKKNHNQENIINWIKKKHLYISSINGFVYQTFHKKKIKEYIYFPDWTSKKRLNFTKKLINILKNIIKKKYDGSISTLPISYDIWVKNYHKSYILYKSSKNILNTIKLLIKTKKQQKISIHLDIEPEPHCTIETYKQIKIFFEMWLIPLYKQFFITKKKIIYTHIKICYDICHFIVNFEDYKKVLNSIQKTNIQIGKIQLSSALKINLQNKIKKPLLTTLKQLNKSPFLHQIRIKKKDKIKKYLDIKYIFNNLKQKKNAELRIHCHAPLYEKIYKNIKTTQKETKTTLKYFLKKTRIKHIEIETYTYNIIYNNNPITAMIKEYIWTINLLKQLS